MKIRLRTSTFLCIFLIACTSKTSGNGQSPFAVRESHVHFLQTTKATLANPNTFAQNLGFEKSAYPYYAPSDGCSGGISERGTRRFRFACLQHDYCYRVGAHGRADCDVVFLALMRKKCDDLNFAIQAPCYAEAQSMYAAVRLWSEQIFENRQRNQIRYENALSEALAIVGARENK